MNNIIFFDVDGVLNSLASAIRCHQWNIQPKHFAGFDLTSVALLRELVSLSHAKLVLTSSWRLKYKTDEECISEWQLQMEMYHGWVNFPIIGMTCNGWKTAEIFNEKQICHRGDEIQFWLEHHPSSNFIILDDSSDILTSQYRNFVHIDHRNGFRFDDFQKSLKLLNVQSEYVEKSRGYQSDFE